jgi:hypothetical protein
MNFPEGDVDYFSSHAERRAITDFFPPDNLSPVSPTRPQLCGCTTSNAVSLQAAGRAETFSICTSASGGESTALAESFVLEEEAEKS